MTRCINQKFMAIDQYGNVYHGLRFPRTELAEIIGTKPYNMGMLYADKEDGVSVHIGYSYKGTDYRLYEVTPYEDIVEVRKVG